MPTQRWEYRTLQLDLEGWFRPSVDVAQTNATLDALGHEGWELVSVLDLNRGHGHSTALVAFLKRAR